MMKLRLILLTGTLCLLPVVAMGQSEGQAELQPVGPTLNIKIHLAGAMNTADLFLTEAGHRYRIRYFDGSTELLTPEQFAQRIYRDHSSRSWLDRVLNITSPVGFAWVLVGLLGQVLFTGRMVLQWLVSEKEKRSVVPPMFWWMSLSGASMLIIYFLWRKDIVGVLGQSTGWFIYIRNLWLIYKPRHNNEQS
jgi:lipid-A-disaccharide synthase-like uncharacterized protein